MTAEVIILSGPVGVGKTTTAHALSDLLGIPHAVIDVDALSWCFPAPADDRFRDRLALQNLAAVWPNYRDAGARRLILVRVIENAETLAAYRALFGGSPVALVRLTAAAEAIAARITHRSAGEDVQGELARARELSEILARACLDEIVVDTTARTPAGVATEILERTGFGQERS